MKGLVLVVSTLLITACGGGGDGNAGSAYCQSVNTNRSNTSGQCNGCSITDSTAVADGSLFTFADITPSTASSTAQISVGSVGQTFAAGSVAGAFITAAFPSGTVSTITLQTSSGESATGSSLQQDATTGGTDAPLFVHFTTTQPFTSVAISFTLSGNTNPGATDLRVYEVCADGHV